MNVNAVSTVDEVTAAIVAAVRAGRIVPGQRLTEAEYSARLGVSRSSVREAFRRLTSDGLLDFAPHRGVAVRQLTRKEVDDLFAIRAALEGLVVSLATRRLHAEPDELVTLRHEMDEAATAGDMNRFTGGNARFHALLAASADNPLLAQTLTRLSNTIYWLQFRVLVDRPAVFDTNREHDRIVDAIVAGDAVAAEAAMRDHVERSRRLIQSLSDEHFATSPA